MPTSNNLTLTLALILHSIESFKMLIFTGLNQVNQIASGLLYNTPLITRKIISLAL